MSHTLSYILMALNIAGMVVIVTLLHRIVHGRRPEANQSGCAGQEVTFGAAVDFASAPLGESMDAAPYPYADTCDRATCGLEREHKMLAAEGGFGEPTCPKCHGPARLIESRLVSVPGAWRRVMRFGDAVVCDGCGYVSEGEVPFISLDPILRNDRALLDAAMTAAGLALARRVRECEALDHLGRPDAGAA